MPNLPLPQLRQWCRERGFLLVRLTGHHYQLKGTGGADWFIDLWPVRTPQVVKPSPQWWYGPLDLPRPWTVQDVCESVAEKLSTLEQPK